jgi:hypothetical protein
MGVLEQVAGGARAQGLEQVVVFVGDREHDHGRLGHARRYLVRRRDTVSRHPDVEQADVRPLALGRGHSGGSVGALGAHHEATPLEGEPEADEGGWMIVGEQDAGRFAYGSTTSITVP